MWDILFLLMRLRHFFGKSIKTYKCLASLENQSNNIFIFFSELFILNIVTLCVVCWSWTLK